MGKKPVRSFSETVSVVPIELREKSGWGAGFLDHKRFIIRIGPMATKPNASSG
jgi:hypothetical protein